MTPCLLLRHFILSVAGDVLTQFENENPLLDPLIKVLLRSYAGIYDHPVAIHEKTLASLLKWSLQEVVKGLYDLHKFQIVNYSPQKGNTANLLQSAAQKIRRHKNRRKRI